MDWISNWKLELLVGQFAGAKRLKTILVRYQLISRKEDEEGAFRAMHSSVVFVVKKNLKSD